MLEGEYIPFKEQFETAVSRHHYSLGYMSTYVTLVLHSIPMRAIETILGFFAPLIPGCLKIPTWYTGRLWLLKFGHYTLFRTHQHAKDWIWIVDHLVQAGNLKCLVVLGIRAKDLPTGRPLVKSDVVVLAVIPTKSSNGDVVYQQLIEVTAKTGTPRSIVADHGPDVKSGIEKFCALTRGTIYLYDIKHCTANLLKQELENDGIWNSFTELAAMTKKYLQQTNLAFLMPPNQRSKSRYMNLECMISWGTKTLQHLDSGTYPVQLDEHKLKCKLGWLPFFRKDIMIWDRMLNRAIHAESHIRTFGSSKGTAMTLEYEFSKMANCHASEGFGQNIIQAVLAEESKLWHGERQLGSTEVLESSFGVYKEFAKEQANSGFTASILAFPAMFAGVAGSIKSGIERTTIKQLRKWTSEYIGETVQAQRKAWFGKKVEEQKCDEGIAA